LKIRADEHVSEEIVNVINKIAISSEFELTSVVSTGDSGSSDVHWVTKFGNNGGKAILTADSDFVKRPPQVMAVHDAGLMIIYLPRKWANASGRLQASHILAWWGRIEDVVRKGKARECWRPEWNVQEDRKLTRITVDYEKARKKLKKANRRSD